MMTLGTQQSGIFGLAERKLVWLDDRQRVLSQNIANADTPGYRARDLVPFEQLVHALTVTPVRTSALHLGGTPAEAQEISSAASERSPDGNAVGLEQQMTKVAEDETSQAAVGNLWRAYMGMFTTALGHGG